MNKAKMQEPTPSTHPEPARSDAAGSASGGKAWPMTLINFWLDALLFISIVVLVWVAMILQFTFPNPSATAGWTLWGLTYDQWHNVEFGALCVTAALVVEHLVLHWNWVCTVLATRVLHIKRPDEASQAVYGVGTFICILILILASLIVAMACVQNP